MPDKEYPKCLAIKYIAAVSINAVTDPDKIALGRATVLPTTSLLFSMAGLWMILLKVLLAGDISD